MKFITLLALHVSLLATDADWPTWRHDALRSGATAHALPEQLSLEWSRDLGKPDPAFDYHFRLCADEANEPVVAGGILFVPSNTTDGVTAYDIGSGALKWRFVTEGPVRFAPAVWEQMVFFGSDDGRVYAVDAITGDLKWKTRAAPEDRADYRMLVNDRLCSRWPVRGGVVLQNGVVYAGCGLWPSEGVFLTALDAATGSVKWRNSEIAQIDDGLQQHGKPADIGLPPHGYLAMIGGKVAMPSGRALAAFCDPANGKLDPYAGYWTKYYPVPRGSWALAGHERYWFQGGALMGTSAAEIEKLPHGPVSFEDFLSLAQKPAAWGEKLAADGVIKLSEENGKRGVLFDPRHPALGVNITPETATAGQLFQMAERPVLHLAPTGTRHEIGERGLPVFTANTMYRCEFLDIKNLPVERGVTRVAPPTYDVLRAYDLDSASWKIDAMKLVGKTQMKRRLEFKMLWELPISKMAVKLLAGDTLYLAGENEIAAVALPKAGEKPRITWKAKTPGTPVGVIAAHDHLIVTTSAGKLLVFGAKIVTPPSLPESPALAWERTSIYRAQIKTLREKLPAAGNALVLGWASGELAKELALQSTLRVIVIENDPAKAAAARDSLQHAGAWAKRLHIVSGTSDQIKLPPYFAEVILCEHTQSLDNGARPWARIALESLRPHTGVAILPLRPQLIDQAKAHAEKIGAGFDFSTTGRLTTIRRLAAPRGADDWTHETASAGNTFASTDTLAVPPFALLWYSGAIDRHFTPAFEYHHDRNPYPVIASGRMFMLAGHDLHAADAYTGRHLWHVTIPESEKTTLRHSDHRTTSRPTDSNYIATPDRIYVPHESEVRVFDAATGRELAPIRVPDDDTPWDECRIADDTLFVTLGSRLVALDRVSGAVKWQHRSDQGRAAFALGGGKVFVAGYATDRGQKAEKMPAIETTLTVLDAKTGESIWTAPLTAPARPEQGTRTASWQRIFNDNALKPTLHFQAERNLVLAIVDRHRFHAFDAISGSPLWHRSTQARLADLVGFEPPTLTRDLILCDDGSLLDPATGQPPKGMSHVGGRGVGCNRYVGSDALVTFRSASACFLDLGTKERTYFSSTRPGCTNSMIPAAGLLNAPNFAHGCVCNYPFLTSFALHHLPEAAKWGPAVKPDAQSNGNRKAD